MSADKKRKVESERQVFDEEWTIWNYFMKLKNCFTNE